jgi:hypothetical protein
VTVRSSSITSFAAPRAFPPAEGSRWLRLGPPLHAARLQVRPTRTTLEPRNLVTQRRHQSLQLDHLLPLFAILDKLTDALDRALDDQGVRKRLLDMGSDIPDKAKRGQQPLAALVKSEIARWTPIIKAANIKAE